MTSNSSVADLRRDYRLQSLSESDVDLDPIRQFARWWEEVLAAEISEPNGMTLATVTPEGKPAARIVLLKGFDHRGFTFFSNYTSHKGEQLTAHPYAALVFWWDPLERQVRIEGPVERMDAGESDEYFHSRPKGSRLGAWASNQSQVIAGREALEHRQQELEQQYQDMDRIPRPPHWGGYRVIPIQMEFWQGRSSRLHDRICYTQQADGWLIQRLAP